MARPQRSGQQTRAALGFWGTRLSQFFWQPAPPPKPQLAALDKANRQLHLLWKPRKELKAQLAGGGGARSRVSTALKEPPGAGCVLWTHLPLRSALQPGRRSPRSLRCAPGAQRLLRAGPRCRPLESRGPALSLGFGKVR